MIGRPRMIADNNAQTNTGEQIVRQGVAHEALNHAEEDKGYTDEPVCLTRATERTGEEDTHHVGEHGHHEHQCSPVVHLTNKQATADVKGNVKRGCVCTGHFDAVERQVCTVVDHLGDRRVEEQGQVDTGQQQDDEAVERHLAEHEGPVRREDLVELRAQDARNGKAGIRIVCGLLKFRTH